MQDAHGGALYITLIARAPSYSEVAAHFRSAVSQGLVSVATTNAVFDRLRALKSGNGSQQELQAAFQLALQEALQRLPDATPRSLAALARAAYHLNLPVPQEEHQRIVSKFLSLVTALQDRYAPKAKPGPAPPKPGWVQLKLSKQGSSAATGTGILAQRGGSNSNQGCVQPLPVQPGMSEVSASSELLQINQNVSNFAWAILSNSQWELQEGQLAALMQCVQRQPMDQPLDSTQVLTGLVRYAASHGEAAVKEYVEQGGVAEALLNRVLQQLNILNNQNCSDVLIR